MGWWKPFDFLWTNGVVEVSLNLILSLFQTYILSHFISLVSKSCSWVRNILSHMSIFTSFADRSHNPEATSGSVWSLLRRKFQFLQSAKNPPLCFSSPGWRARNMVVWAPCHMSFPVM